MLRIYTDIIDFLRASRPLIDRIARHDRDLVRQLRRAGASVALNLAEGYGVSAGSKRSRYLTALGSARELRACFDVADAFGYAPPLGQALDAKLDIIIATLWKLSR